MLRTLALPACLVVLTGALLAPDANANLISNPSFETNTTGWSVYGSGATMTRVAGGRTGGFAVRCVGTSSTSLHFGINDNPNWIANAGAAGTRYRFTCWVRSDGSRGQIKIKIKEFSGSTQQGSTVYSAPITLATTWQMATADYVVTTAGTTLDLVIEDYPVAASEAYYIDDVGIENLTTPPVDDPPVARLSVTQLATPALTVRADASASTDADATPIASYVFDFGDGTPPATTTAPTATAQHAYAAAGVYTVGVIATDTGGKVSEPDTQFVIVSPPPPDAPPVARLTVTQLADPVLTVRADASASTDGDATPIATYEFDFGDGTAPVPITAPTAVAQHTYGDVGVYVVTLRVTDTGGLTSAPDTAAIGVAPPPPPPDDPPVARLTVTNLASPPLTVLADGSASTDGDVTPIETWQFDFGDGTPPVLQTTATVQHTYATAGTYTVTLVATDAAGLTSAPATAATTVGTTTNLIANPSFETGTSGWIVYGSGATLTRVSGGHTGGFALQCRGTSSTSLHFGINDSPNWVANAGAAGTRYRFSFWARSDASRGNVKLKVKEFLGSTQKGSTAYSAPITLSPTWQTTSIDYVVTTAGTTLDLVIEDYPVASTETYLIDDVAIERVSGSGSGTDDPPVARLTVVQLTSPALTVRADASTSTDVDATPIATYRFNFGDGTSAVTTTAPTAIAQHTYAATGTYTVGVTVTDTGGKTSSTTASITVTSTPTSSSNVAVYVGYYDTHHPGRTRPKPNPWMGSTGVVFVGTPDNSSGGWDSSALRIDNLTGSPISNVVVTVDIASHHYALWGTRTIPAGQKLILAQTGFENFDGSDTNPAGCYGCSPTLCTTRVTNTVPVVHVSIGGVRTDYYDAGQILNTHGVDAAGCPYTGTRNDESEAWQQVSPQAAAMASQPGPDTRQMSDSDVLQESAGPIAFRFGLEPVWPNPSRGDLSMRFRLARTGEVRLAVFDLAGRRVETVVEGLIEPGEYETRANLRGLAEGVYFCMLTAPDGVLRRTFVLMR